MFPRKIETFSFLLVVLLSLAVAVLIARQIVAFEDFPFDFDEANHVNGALALYLELRDLNLDGFLSEFMSQGFYPPGFAWMKAIAFVLFGASSTVARFFSVVSLFLALIVIYLLPLEIDRDYGWLAGLTAVALTLTIQPLLVTSAMVMMEAPGLLATFAMLWIYVRAIKLPTRTRLLSVSLLLILVFLTKFTYGLIVVAAIFLMECSLVVSQAFGTGGQENGPGLLSSSRAVIERRWPWLFGPFLAAMIVWFIRPDNIQGFLAYASSQPPDQQWITWDNLFFYPRSFANQFVPSPPFALFSVASLIWGIWRWRDPLVRLLVIYFLVGAALMTVNLPKNPRFIATIAPALHILSGLMLGQAVATFRSGDRHERWGAAVLIALMLAAAVISVPTVIERFTTYPSLLEIEYETSPQSNEILKWIGEQVPQGERFYVLNYWDQMSPQRIAWDLATEPSDDAENADFDDLLMPSALVQEATAENISDLRERILGSGATYVVLFEGGAWGLPFWPEHNQAMQDVLEPIARERFQVSYFDTGGWQDMELLTRAEWERVKEEGQYTLDINVIVFRLHPSD